ncbi:cytochrome c oxidase subunit 2 [Melghiribacillus thermohalophilus]|uniref:Cytochrome aa3 subunit 2 n=1 Tax=Melghiribacillus thermohalophilus TaxID=1324956 RepID=A0A4R3NE84_9BACI|nr:cytochrome c oxidase subunit II [Melghiribacillus thermohalophilus]TCT25526.1 cytochrome c oxidase subunit 2 [Melghiribacillus thermohalophilus]
MHLHRYEKIWIIFGTGALLAFLIILGIGAFYQGSQPPSCMVTIDPQNVQAHEAFKEENLGLNQVGENEYVVNILASAFNYDLGKDENGAPVKTIRIPAGAKVTFQATTSDVIHGFELAGTNVNMMLEPGYISEYETTMDNPGTYTLICNEYCGTGHHLMYATVEVYEE